MGLPHLTTHRHGRAGIAHGNPGCSGTMGGCTLRGPDRPRPQPLFDGAAWGGGGGGAGGAFFFVKPTADGVAGGVDSLVCAEQKAYFTLLKQKHYKIMPYTNQ
jgi:hypothetical protein